ncbi:cysteine/glutathione ABC transporter ATP-binding protein/permease CydC [Shewanella sp. VB17]|uniref:heme ABC transporter ATP-binding protein/permease CydC n=1 Tax=Shewanella sp. VB17 TaxID=2739432 RepID=UPI001564C1A4|nr:cysteine/glutathione ABC transporter ATP-binding protein/permease CydC [Shewanella sp. VB17]NRD75313.1 cysteine/glutathione ABC transporter ATP-binding protein/permease CydC [Shewanella sp. VB17]
MKVLLPFITLFKHQWLMMFTGLLLSVVTLMAGVGLLSLAGWFLSAAAVAGLSVATAQMFNYFTPAGGVRFFSIVRTASRYGERLATHEATFKLLTQLRVWAWQKLLPLSAKNLQGLRQGDLLNRLVADIDTLDHLYLRLLTPMAASFMLLVALYFFVAWFDTELALLLCTSLLVTWLLLPLIFYYLGRRPGVEMLEHKRYLRVQLLEFIQGQAEISLFGATDRFRSKLQASESAFFASQSAMANVTALSQAILVLCHGSAVVLIFYVAASGVGEYVPPGPMLAVMVFMIMACIEMLMPIAGAFQHLSSCVLAATRITELMDQQPDIVFSEDDSCLITQGEIKITDLSFGYDEKNPVLEQLNISIKAGENVALLGQTGCGKSSLFSLLNREWEPQIGEIYIDGEKLNTYSEASLRQGISSVSQRIYLFSGTLRSNLTLAQSKVGPLISRPLAEVSTVNDIGLIEVLNKVGLGALTRGENPLDIWIGEGGRQLSGGEQRRIGVARVLLRDAPILLLDEPTEGLDKRTEREILALLFQFAKDKTVVMISHRLTAMEQMDSIYLMEEGGILASGSHAALLKSNQYYIGLHNQIA